MSKKYLQIDAAQMRALADIVKEALPKGLGFMIMTFEPGENNVPSNYVSNCDRADMIKEMRELADRLEKNQETRTFDRGSKLTCTQCFNQFPDSLELRSVGCPQCGGLLMG